jgi:hypothetical protein
MPDSKTLGELANVTREQARITWDRLCDGYTDKSHAGYGPAKRNLAGCILVQKGCNRQENGYCQVAPVVMKRTRGPKGSPAKAKPRPQGAHRLAVIAFKNDADVQRMLQGDHVSHLCSQPTCINPQHLTVEPKHLNEARKQCKCTGPIIKTRIDNTDYYLPPKEKCECAGAKCIKMIEFREAQVSPSM